MNILGAIAAYCMFVCSDAASILAVRCIYRVMDGMKESEVDVFLVFERKFGCLNESSYFCAGYSVVSFKWILKISISRGIDRKEHTSELQSRI